MRIIARFLGDPRSFSLIFNPGVPDGEKLGIAGGWGERHFWATAAAIPSMGYGHIERVIVDVGKAYVLEADENGPDPVEMIERCQAFEAETPR